jgi:hypothetical protein
MCGFEKVTSSILHNNWTPRTDRKRSVWIDTFVLAF